MKAPGLVAEEVGVSFLPSQIFKRVCLLPSNHNWQVNVDYQIQKDFRDITSGNNEVNDGNIHVKGFQAEQGWDAVTGWGSPQASQLIPDLIAAMK
jgi:hypothetical protein